MNLRMKNPYKLGAASVVLVLALSACAADDTADDESAASDAPDTSAEDEDDAAAANGEDEEDGSAEERETITLSVADSRSAEHYAVAGGVIPWMERIEELTDGVVEFEFFPAEQLGSLSDHLSLLRGGVADIAYLPPSFFGGEMPLSEVHSLPGMFVDSLEASRAFHAASNQTAIADVDYASNDLKHLWGAMTWPGEFFLRDDQRVESVDDLAGLNIRGSGGALDAGLSALGTSVTTLPTPEVYQAMETGTVDGTAMAHASVLAYSVEEVSSFVTEGFAMGSFWMPQVMSASSWDALPDDVKDAFETASDEAVEFTATVIETATEEAIVELEAAGLEIVALSEADRDRVQELFAPIIEEWIVDAEEGGLSDAREVYEFIRERDGASG